MKRGSKNQKILLYKFFLIFVCLTEKALFQDLKLIKEIPDKLNDIRIILPSFNKKNLIIVKNKTIDLYEIKTGDLKFKRNTFHPMDFDKNYIYANIDKGGELFLFSSKNMSYYDDQNGLIKLGSFNLDPESKIKKFSNYINFNKYDLKFIMKDGTNNNIFEWDYRNNRLSIHEINTKKDLNIKLKFLKYVDQGFKIAALYEDNDIIIVDTTKKLAYKITKEKIEKILNNKNIDLLEIQDSSRTGEMIVVSRGSSFIFFDAEHGNIKKTVKIEDKIQKTYIPSGTYVMIIFTKNEILFMNLKTRKIVDTLKINETKLRYYLPGTNIFVSEKNYEETDKRILQNDKNKMDEDEKTKIYEFYTFQKKRPIYCHVTCGKKCRINFKPCDGLWKFFLIYAICFSSCFMLCCIFWQIERFFEPKNDRLGDDQENEQLEKKYGQLSDEINVQDKEMEEYDSRIDENDMSKISEEV